MERASVKLAILVTLVIAFCNLDGTESGKMAIRKADVVQPPAAGGAIHNQVRPIPCNCDGMCMLLCPIGCPSKYCDQKDHHCYCRYNLIDLTIPCSSTGIPKLPPWPKIGN